MTLREYLDREALSLTDFAARLGVPVTTAHGYVSGRRTPSLEWAVKIEDATAKAVMVRDLLPTDSAAA